MLHTSEMAWKVNIASIINHMMSGLLGQTFDTSAMLQGESAMCRRSWHAGILINSSCLHELHCGDTKPFPLIHAFFQRAASNFLLKTSPFYLLEHNKVLKSCQDYLLDTLTNKTPAKFILMKWLQHQQNSWVKPNFSPKKNFVDNFCTHAGRWCFFMDCELWLIVRVHRACVQVLFVF